MCKNYFLNIPQRAQLDEKTFTQCLVMTLCDLIIQFFQRQHLVAICMWIQRQLLTLISTLIFSYLDVEPKLVLIPSFNVEKKIDRASHFHTMTYTDIYSTLRQCFPFNFRYRLHESLPQFKLPCYAIVLTTMAVYIPFCQCSNNGR